MELLKTSIILAVCVVLCASHPTKQATRLPVLKNQPAEVLFKADNYSTVLLECVTENQDKDVKYTWHKNGEPFDWEAAGHIAQRLGEGSIMFFNPQPEDEGTYQCFAQTQSGTATTRPIALKKAFIKTTEVKTKEHSPIRGRPYKLDCEIPESYPKPTIVWKTQLRSDPTIINNILSPRITLSPDGNLWFSNVTDSDISPSFKYICVAQTPAVKKEVILAEHFLSSLLEDTKANDGELVPQYLSNDMVAKVGDVTMIYCIYGGTPLGYPDWFKDGKSANGKPGDRVTEHNRTGGKRLLIKETLLKDEGTYTCEVYNGVGKKQSHSMKLSVISAPKLTNEIEKQLDVIESHDIKIPCQVTGLPEPEITWTFNGKEIKSPRYENGALVLPKVKKGDSGYYGCRAVNKHGLIYTETLVNVV